MQVTVTVNGTEYTRDVDTRLLLVHFLRDDLGLTGTHWGCDTSNCGACVVWLDELPVKSCTVLAAMADGRRVLTVEGLERDGRLDPVQEGFARAGEIAAEHCRPASDQRGPADYKRHLARELTTRALRRALRRARGG